MSRDPERCVCDGWGTADGHPCPGCYPDVLPAPDPLDPTLPF